MRVSDNGLPRIQRRFPTVWSELEYLCRRIHYWLYRSETPNSVAKRYVARLERVLKELPGNDMAILREEGWALLFELKGELRQAIGHHQKEINLIEKLHKSVERSVQAGDYDKVMAKSICAGHDQAALRERQAILRSLRVKARPISA